MPAWLVTFLSGILKIIISTTLKDLFDAFMEDKALRDWKNAERAKLEAAAEKYKADLQKAGDDEQAQKDAFDKLINGTR